MSEDDSIDLRTVLADMVRLLSASGIPDPSVDAELLICAVTGLSRGEVQAGIVLGRRLTREEAVRVSALAARRRTREPLQHITGAAPFRLLELAVGPGVFVPRPETEHMAEAAVDTLRASAEPRPLAVDLGTGSGALALTLANEVPNARVIGVESSVEAYMWAVHNRNRFALEAVTMAFGEIGEVLGDIRSEAALVVSNPPYIPDSAIPIDPEVHFFDPPAALYGGEDGLDIVRDVEREAWRMLRSGGTLMIEHGEQQGDQMRGLLAAAGWSAPATFPDLTMRERFTTAVRP